MNDITEYKLPTNAYASFDARSIRDLIIRKLNEDDNISFTDQNFEGSNLNAIIDIVAYSFHTLLFYLNQTSSESIFTDTQLYENMNRIVKLIDYKPIGKQTSIVPININVTGSLTSNGFYTIPRYSFVSSNGKTYSIVSDSSFGGGYKSQILMYEGRFNEYPVSTAIGEPFESITLLPGEDILIDHFNIFVYIKESDGKWYEYKKTPSLYLVSPQEKSFECRLNQNKNYEITFGNNINGRQLQEGDEIAIYYLASTGNEGQITKNLFNESPINIFNTDQFDDIFEDVKDTTLEYITIENSVDVQISNTEDSTLYDEEETTENIRSNAPKFFSSEYKLITKPDYQNFIDRNFKNFIYDVKVGNNSDFLNHFTKYLTQELRIRSYSEYNNVLFNQYNYSDTFNVNNIYVTAVPKFKKGNSVVTRSNYISTSLKNNIINSLRRYKLLNSEVTFLDPVYLEVDFLVIQSRELRTVRHINNTELVIVKNSSDIINETTIISKVYNIIKNYFDNVKLGEVIDIKGLNSQIISIEGVNAFYTRRTDTNYRSEGLSLGFYNPIYNGADLKVIDSNYQLYYFQIPYIRDYTKLLQKIRVDNVTRSRIVDEY